MKEIKLQVGKTYRNRKGEEVKIVERIGGGPYQFKGSNGECYTERGIWRYFGNEDLEDLIEEVGSTRHTFTIPDGVSQVTIEQEGNRIVVEMVPEAKEPKPGDVCINDSGSVYIFKEVVDSVTHKPYVWLGKRGELLLTGTCLTGRPATAEEAKPIFDALKKFGKKWNPEVMKVEDVPEIERILEWVEANIKDGYYNHEDVAEAIEAYLKHKEGEK